MLNEIITKIIIILCCLQEILFSVRQFLSYQNLQLLEGINIWIIKICDQLSVCYCPTTEQRSTKCHL